LTDILFTLQILCLYLCLFTRFTDGTQSLLLLLLQKKAEKRRLTLSTQRPSTASTWSMEWVVTLRC